MPASNVAAEKRSQPQILVETAGLSEEEWLAYRRKGIGGSDVAALLGISPWRTARDLYFDKLNIVAVEDNEDNWVALEMGHLLEPLVAKIFQHRTGYKVYQIKKMFQHPQYSWMLADVDYFVELPDGSTAILEIKTTNYNARDMAVMFRTICATSGQRIISATQTPKRIIRKKKSLYRTPTMEKISPEPPKRSRRKRKRQKPNRSLCRRKSLPTMVNYRCWISA